MVHVYCMLCCFRGTSIRQTENFTYKETSINIVFIYNKLAINENLNRVEITHTQKKCKHINNYT